MEISMNNRTLKIKTGTRFLRELNNVYQLEADGARVDFGLEQLFINFQMKSVSALALAIYAGTRTNNFKPTYDQIDDWLDEQEDIDYLFEAFEEQLRESMRTKKGLERSGKQPAERVDLEQIIDNAMRYLGYSLKQAEEMTIREYSYEMHAYNLRRVDKERDMHMQAFLNRAVKATKKQGKNTAPVYKRFKDFYNHEKEVARITRPIERNRNIEKLMVQANSL